MANNEIVFTDYQADVFNEAETLLKTQGYLGEPLFEDTYVLNKRLAEWVMANTSMSGTTIASSALNAYNGVLGIETDIPSAPPVTVRPERSEPIMGGPAPMPIGNVKNIRTFPTLTSSVRVNPATFVAPKNITRPPIATPVAPMTPRSNPATVLQQVRNSLPFGGGSTGGSFLDRFRNG